MDLTSTVGQEEEIALLKEQVKLLQGKVSEEENARAKELKHSKRVGKTENPEMEEES